MIRETNFAEILEAACELTLEEQEDLIGILQNRLRESRRATIVKDVRSATEEFAQGKCQPVTPLELMKEILS
jgi:ribosome recycling factor